MKKAEKAENTEHLNLNNIYKSGGSVLQSPLFRSACMTLLIILITGVRAYAQDLPVGADTGVEDTASRLFAVMYLNWRIPFTAVGLVYAGFLAITDEQRGISRALKVTVIVIAIALVPSIIKLIGTLTQTPTP